MQPHVDMLIARLEEEANREEEDSDNEPQVGNRPNWANNYETEAAGGQIMVEQAEEAQGQEVVGNNPAAILEQIHGLATATATNSQVSRRFARQYFVSLIQNVNNHSNIRF